MAPDDLPILPFASPTAWEAWLEEHHASSPGVWLKIAKKTSGIETVTHAEALELALCFGWIDGQRNRLGDEWFLQRFLDDRPAAKEFFETLNGTNRYAVLYRIHDAKRPETRARRIEKFVAMLARGEKLHP